ncbi:DUF2871 domain-containing protein [Peptacetobacter sp.]|uniref:DUF2871 domain-containing protein n=1 Tax=Peptacetobacter sp. TaxID=2991975 RepID=UPI00261E9BC1|nr:DUF2871 domain-containing protein [Peptacetobacter sp.]
MERRFVNTSFFYMILAMISGVFFREFTKYNNFNGVTSLGKLHVHLFVLGMIFFLIVTILEKEFRISKDSRINNFYILYNVGIVMTVIMLLVRGIVEVKQVVVTSVINASIAGFSGIAHIIIFISMITFFMILKKAVNSDIN